MYIYIYGVARDLALEGRLADEELQYYIYIYIYIYIRAVARELALEARLADEDLQYYIYIYIYICMYTGSCPGTGA